LPSAFCEIYHNICKNIDNRLSSIIVFCDISKAFDRVWHKALIKKLQSYGITGDLLHWLDDCKEYLNRILRGKHIVSEVALELNMDKIVDLRENRDIIC
jgi:hypothetical protein